MRRGGALLTPESSMRLAIRVRGSAMATSRETGDVYFS